MSSVIGDDGGLPDMKALYKTNPLIPDPSKLEVKVIPAEDIAGWFMPFEIVFGMVYWESLGLYLLLAFVGTVLFGWIIPMQQRYALLARTEFLKEKTQLGHLLWTEQAEFIRFEPILEPAMKEDAEGKLIVDEEGEPILDELDLQDWATTLDLDDRIIEHDDGVVSSVITLDANYVASLFNSMYHKRLGTQGQFSTDKVGWTLKNLKTLGLLILKDGRRGLPILGRGIKKALRGTGHALKGLGGVTKRGLGGFGGWVKQHRVRFLGSFILGTLLIMFSKWILLGLRFLLTLIGW